MGLNVLDTILSSNKPELLAELICEKKLFLEGFVTAYKKYLSKNNFSKDGVQNTPQPLALTVVVADNRCFDS